MGLIRGSTPHVPLPLSFDAVQATSVVLFSKHNQKYLCTLPRQLAVVEQEEEVESDPSMQHRVRELLEPLKKTCFTKVSKLAWLNRQLFIPHTTMYRVYGQSVS